MRDSVLERETQAANGTLAGSTDGHGNIPPRSPAVAADLFSQLAEADCGLIEMRTLLEKWIVLRSLEKHHFNQCHAAKELGIHRNSLCRRLREWGWQLEVEHRRLAWLYGTL